MNELLAVIADTEDEVKIIKHGTAPGDNLHRATCNNCGTKIEFMQGEAERIFDPRDGDYLRIKCPVCPRDITKAIPAPRQWA